MRAIDVNFLKGKEDEYWQLFKDSGNRKYESKWNALLKKKEWQFLTKHFPYTFEQIIKMDFKGLVDVFVAYRTQFLPAWEMYHKKHSVKANRLKNSIAEIFRYKSKKEDIHAFFRRYSIDLNLHSCLYCDITPIYCYHCGHDMDQFNLDHILDWSDCPIVAYSMYNFVPSCSTCNTNHKGKRLLGAKYGADGKLQSYDPRNMVFLSPTRAKYDLDGSIRIKIIPFNNHNLNYEKNSGMFHIDFETVKGGAKTYQETITFFGLKERYNAAEVKDRALHLAEKCRVNPKVYRRMMAKKVGVTMREFDATFFDEVYFKYELNKLYRDILKEHSK